MGSLQDPPGFFILRYRRQMLTCLCACDRYIPEFDIGSALVPLHKGCNGRPEDKVEHLAFGPESLGVIIVRELPEQFADLRRKLLSLSSYLANLPEMELGKT
nr:hypothetical protein CFP56_36186 [Quercus suber]